MFKIAIDAGHGLNTSGKQTPDGEKEWGFNNVVATACVNELKNYENVEIQRMDDTDGSTDVSLDARTDKANNWGADCYVSIHHNAYKGVWGTHGGTETLTQTGSYPEAEKLAKNVHIKILEAYGLKDRGLKKDDNHVTRETKMSAIITEGGFMDSTIDIEVLRNSEQIKKAGVAIASGIAVTYGLKKKSCPSTPPPQSSTKEITYRSSAHGYGWCSPITGYHPEKASSGMDYSGIKEKKHNMFHIEPHADVEWYQVKMKNAGVLSKITPKKLNMSDGMSYAGINTQNDYITAVAIKMKNGHSYQVYDNDLNKWWSWMKGENANINNVSTGCAGAPPNPIGGFRID